MSDDSYVSMLRHFRQTKTKIHITVTTNHYRRETCLCASMCVYTCTVICI